MEFQGERPLVFRALQVRVAPNFRLEMHLDTDDANAVGAICGMQARIVKEAEVDVSGQSCWYSCRHSETGYLVGSKLMLVAPYEGEGQTIVAVDTVGAGVGEVVLLTLGNPARNAVDRNSPVDAAIVGIVDSVERK